MRRGWKLASGILVIVLLVVTFEAVSTWAATPIYVRTDGDDTNCNGTANVAYSSDVAPNCAVQTIQKGVNLVDPNGTVNVAAGTYDEQVVIDKSLTLQGVGDTTIIRPSSAAKLTSLYTLGTQAGAYWNGQKLASIINVSGVGSAGVTIKDLKVDGVNITSLPSGANYVVGISYGETGGTIDGVTVVNMNSVPTDTRTYGMWLDAVSAAVSVEVKGSTIAYYNKNGLNARGAALTVNIHHNTITGPGTVSGQVLNGMGIMFGARGTVASNEVNNHWDEFAEWDASGIFTYNTSGVLIQGNTVTNSAIGIALSGIPNTGGTANSTVQANTTYDCGVGIQLEAPGTTNNTIIGNIIRDNGVGIYLMEHYPFDGGDDYGVGAGNEAHCNNIYSNDVFGVENGNPDVTFNAENNWWGAASGPSGQGPGTGDAVSTNVDFTPWVRVQVPEGVQCGLGGVTDTDNDGLADTLEMGGDNDQDPTTTTDPLDPDTDNDGLLDGEDENHNGRVDTGETDPNNWDTDGDTLCDGSASLPTGTACTTVSKSGRNGEDLDGDENTVDRGVTETDPTKADTDGDGINDFDDDIPLRPGGGGCFGVVAYSTPSRVTYRPTARMASTRIIIVTIINNSGGDLIVTGGAFTPQPDEVFTIVRVSPTLPRTIRNGRRASFSVLTQVAAGKPPVTAVAPYFNIWLACGVVTSASVEPVELEGVRAELRGDELRVEANGSGIASIQLQLFDLAGRAVVNRTGKGSALAAPLAANASGKRLANGVYLYVVTVKGFDGSIQRSEVRKLVVLR